jgi:hypothetical protein
MNRRLLLACMGAVFCFVRAANAQEATSSVRSSSPLPNSATTAPGEAWKDATRPPSAERRSGFTMGLSQGFRLGRAYGYPNEAEKIDRAAYQSDTGFAVGFGYVLWVGGALTDWFTVSVGLNSGQSIGNGLQAAAGGLVLHLEVFPLFPASKAGQNLGVLINFGAGNVQILKDNSKLADGGSMSMVGLGACYEPLRFWHFSAGPTLEGTYLFSRSARDLSLTAGLRLAFYGGP